MWNQFLNWLNRDARLNGMNTYRTIAAQGRYEGSGTNGLVLQDLLGCNPYKPGTRCHRLWNEGFLQDLPL